MALRPTAIVFLFVLWLGSVSVAARDYTPCSGTKARCAGYSTRYCVNDYCQCCPEGGDLSLKDGVAYCSANQNGCYRFPVCVGNASELCYARSRKCASLAATGVAAASAAATNAAAAAIGAPAVATATGVAAAAAAAGALAATAAGAPASVACVCCTKGDLVSDSTSDYCPAVQVCSASYAWKPAEWGACSQTCGGGIQTRPAAACVRADDARDVPAANCASPAPETQRVCNTEACARCAYSCLHGGRCDVDRLPAPACVCVQGYWGPDCGRSPGCDTGAAAHCLQCVNDATGGTFRCPACLDDWAGDTCQQQPAAAATPLWERVVLYGGIGLAAAVVVAVAARCLCVNCAHAPRTYGALPEGNVNGTADDRDDVSSVHYNSLATSPSVA